MTGEWQSSACILCECNCGIVVQVEDRCGTANKRGTVQCSCRSVVRTSRGNKRRSIVCSCVRSWICARCWRRT